MLSELTVLDPSGDTTVTWDPVTGTGLDIAERKFNELVVHKGHAAYELQPNDQGVAIRAFNPQAQKIFLTPRLAGG